MLGGFVTEQTQNTQRLRVECIHRTEQRRLGIERLTGVGAERGRDVESAVLDECIGRGIPGGISASLKGCAQTAGGEGGCVGFAADQLLTGKFHYDLAVSNGRNEGVVLFGGNAGERLEPMGVVGCPFFHSPILHRVCHDVCD